MSREVAPAELTLEEITAGYDRTTVLRDLDLTVSPASVTAVLGPNGAGKSTLLKVMSGVLRPTAGRVLLDGEDITRLAPHERVRKGICHIPEGHAVYRTLTVRDNLRMQAVRGGENVAIGKAVDVFPVLGRKLEQAAGTMSGGEQQMLAMARAWIREPRIILVDEASLGLAPRVVESIFDFLAQLATGGTSLVVVDQFVARALDLADRAHVMTRGELSFSGSAAELRDRDVFRDYVSGDPGNAPEVGVG